MEECYLKEKINSLRNEMNHVWGATFIIGGGTFGLSIIENKTVWIITLIILGAIWTVLFINAYMIRRNQLIDLTELLKIGG